MHQADRIVLAGGTSSGGRSGKLVESIELARVDRLQGEMALRQSLDAAGTVEPRPFGAQRGDGVVLAPDLHAQLGDALRLRCVEFELDLVDVARPQARERRSRRY